MKPEEILEHTRRLIAEHAGDDPDEWWYANRFVFARLNLDERKTKTEVKQRLFERKAPCHHCGKAFTTRKNVHLHRLDNLKGYRDDNCVLMHDNCHEKYHKLHPPKARRRRGRGRTVRESTGAARSKPRGVSRGRKREFKGPAESILVKRSSPYEKSFHYWWDISPGLAEDLGEYDAVEFACKDSGASCTVPVPELKRFLTPDRRTSRGGGNWGIRVLKGREDELAFEPGRRGQRWRFLPVVWIDEREED